MANSILTIDMITREAVPLFINSNAFIASLNRQYDSYYAIDGAKIGDTLRIRLPNDYTVTDGAAASFQSTTEQYTTMTLAYQRHVDTSFSSVDLTLSMDDYIERILLPKMNVLAGNCAAQVMSLTSNNAANYVEYRVTGTLTAPIARTWLLAGAALSNNSAMTNGRKIVMSAQAQADTVANLSGFFNPQTTISDQYRSGEMSRNTLGFDWMMDQTVLSHTNGAFTTGTVNGASQTGTTLTVSAIGAALEQGDYITIAGVYAVNRVTKESTGQLRQFVVTADAAAGATSLSIYPAITPAVGGSAVQYQTVTASPANGATITQVGTASETYMRNLAYWNGAITLGTADLIMPPNVEGSRRSQDGISMRSVKQYMIGTDVLGDRVDILFGTVTTRPEWVCVVASPTS